jgi:hypothetical protein
MAAKAVVAEFRTEKETRKQSFPGHGVDVERIGDRVVIKGSFETAASAAAQRGFEDPLQDGHLTLAR